MFADCRVHIGKFTDSLCTLSQLFFQSVKKAEFCQQLVDAVIGPDKVGCAHSKKKESRLPCDARESGSSTRGHSCDDPVPIAIISQNLTQGISVPRFGDLPEESMKVIHGQRETAGQWLCAFWKLLHIRSTYQAIRLGYQLTGNLKITTVEKMRVQK